MKVEGMVHAPEQIRRLLKPDGYLIDIHPIREAAFTRVYRVRRKLFEESDPCYDYHDTLRHADHALEEAVQRGLFHIEGKDEFEFVTYASSVSEMKDYWATYDAFDDKPKDEAITTRQNEMYARADKVMRAAGGKAELADHEGARITRLRPAR